MNTTFNKDVAQSLFNFIEHSLMEQGSYFNIVTGQASPDGVDISKFIPVVDPELQTTSGYIWQSYFHNFAYESGVLNKPAPTVISGVYVNGTFVPKSQTLLVDHENGRVIFSSPQALNAVVQSNFSVKEYSFLRPNPDRLVKSDNKFVVNSDLFTNGFVTTPYLTYLPAIFVEVTSSNEKGFEFGGVHESNPIYQFKILSDNQSQIESIASVMESISEKSFPVVSASQGPKFNSIGDLSEPYSFYDWFKKTSNFAYIKSVRYYRFFEARLEENQPRIFAGVVNIEISAIR